MTNRQYRTVAGAGNASFEIRGSEFIGRVRQAPDRSAAESHITDVQDEHPDATHVVSAYRVRVGDGPKKSFLREHEDDDGEPSGSAGGPARTVLERQNLENVVATVVRYYGGTNLGVGGLARAYGRAVGDAISDAGITEVQPREHLTVTVAYDDSGTVRGVLESADVTFEAEYGEQASFEVRVPTAECEILTDRLRSATGDRVKIDQ